MWDQRGQSRRWLLFTVWIGLAALCAFIDYSLQRTIALPIFLIASFGTVYFAFRNQRPSRFRFELLNHGSKGVRSALGFEVHLTHDGIKYREGDHTLFLRPFRDEQPVQVFGRALPPNAKWAPPFQEETISESKKKEIFSAIVAAVGYLQGTKICRR